MCTNDAEATAVMKRFARAYFSGDAARLSEVITPDAEWLFAFGADSPDGRVHRGIDGFMQGIRKNAALFERLRFDNVNIRSVGEDEIVMTYLAVGRYRRGDDFQLRGVELIRIEHGRLARKDVFWKGYVPQ